MIKHDETRKLDYTDCGKSLKNLYLHLYLYFSYFSFIIFKMLFFIFGHCPKNCSIARKKIILPDSGGCSPPSSYAYAADLTRAENAPSDRESVNFPSLESRLDGGPGVDEDGK